MLNSEQNDEDPIAIGCDATDDDSSTAAGNKKENLIPVTIPEEENDKKA